MGRGRGDPARGARRGRRVPDGRQVASESTGPCDDRTVTGRVPGEDAAQPARPSERATTAPTANRCRRPGYVDVVGVFIAEM